VNVAKGARNDVDGVLLLNKPRGISSQQAVARAKRLFAARKAGHTGTLDPMADGLLPIGFGEATKFAQFLLDSDKQYLAILQLGATTNTGDAEGEILERHPVGVSVDAIDAVLRRFTGPQVQTPPMHSAVKVDGKPLYAYARAGLAVERKAREICIHFMQLVDFSNKLLKIRVSCSKGTYIRVLAEEIGAALGCGAHLCGLTRETAGDLGLGGAVSIAELEAMDMSQRMARLLATDTFASSLPRLMTDAGVQQRLISGQRVPLPEAAPGLYRLYGDTDTFFGVGEVAEGILRARRLLIQSREPAPSPDGLSNPLVTR
jgi:tRNA pseudouridine55 synthase